MASCRSYAREGFIGPRCAVLRRRGLLLLGGRDLLLLPTLYAVRLDHASDRTRSAGVQICRDRLVVAARSDDSLTFDRGLPTSTSVMGSRVENRGSNGRLRGDV